MTYEDAIRRLELGALECEAHARAKRATIENRKASIDPATLTLSPYLAQLDLWAVDAQIFETEAEALRLGIKALFALAEGSR